MLSGRISAGNKIGMRMIHQHDVPPTVLEVDGRAVSALIVAHGSIGNRLYGDFVVVFIVVNAAHTIMHASRSLQSHHTSTLSP